jgi:hypothetical protein
VRAASWGDPIEGELPHPRSLANGTEPHLANPRERFHGRVANPYRMGHGPPLESPDNSSTRNPQSATRSMGVVETSPSVPRRDGEGASKYKSESSPRSPRTGPGSGARRTATPLGSTERRQRQSCVCGAPRPAGTLPTSVEINTPHARGSRENPLQEHSRSCRASGARPMGPLTRPHGIALATRREERPISKRQHLRDPNRYTRRCSGATVGDSHKGPLNNQGKPA